MDFLIDFIRQKVPKSKKENPAYYRRALRSSAWILAVNCFANTLLLAWVTERPQWIPAAIFGGVVCCLYCVDRMDARLNLAMYAALSCMWCGWFVHACGWGIGCQYLLVPVLGLVFFNIYEPPPVKLAYFFVVFAYRMVLFAFSFRHPALYRLSLNISIIIQLSNSAAAFFMLAVHYILFSSNTQAIERQLRLNNQELHREAGTDPLTQLPNRRALLNEMETFRNTYSGATFSVAIADIDFFKKVNDTYGHNCGDYTLKALAELFREKAGERYAVCRWGGEEFCFFLPGMNVDQAGDVLTDLHIAVSQMQLSYTEHEFSITITVGIEENDFESPIADIVDRADHKLYLGKMQGRNRVVI